MRVGNLKAEIQEGEVYRLEGPASLRLLEGCLRISGAVRGEEAQIVVPRLKAVPVEALARSTIEYKLGKDGRLEKLSGKAIPESWLEAIEKIRKVRGRILILGNTDVGKTFFTTYAGNMLFQDGLEVAVLDGDIGQSDIGPPSTMALGKFERLVCLLSEVRAREMYFVGDVSPAGRTFEFLEGITKLARLGSEISDVLLVNTPGWITGRGASLQIMTGKVLSPDLIVGIQRTNELDGILEFFPSTKVCRLPVSPYVRKRTLEERAEIRRLNFARYFESAKRVDVDLNTCRISGEGDRKAGLDLLVGGVLVGLLNRGGRLLGLGIIENVDPNGKNATVLTPVEKAEEISEIRLGSIRIKPSGEEISSARREER